MQESNYIHLRDDLIDKYTDSIDLANDEYLNGQMNMVSAGLVNYLPAIEIEQHEHLFKQVLLHKKLSILEQSDYEVLDYVQTEGLTDELLLTLKERPVVICTFHTGSYRIINLLLCKHHINYTLVVGKEVMKQDGELFVSMFRNLPKKKPADGFTIIDAEDPRSGLQMLRELKRGRSLLLYIDGNTGAGTNKHKDHTSIDFLQQQLFARKGIAFLAHVAGVPILPVVCHRNGWKEICLQFFDLIFPNTAMNREQFAHETTQQLYNLAATIIKQYPEQWEGWLYLHKCAKIIKTPDTSSEWKEEHDPNYFQFDSCRYGLLKVNGLPFLLQKHSYSFLELDHELYEVLKGSVGKSTNCQCIEKQMLERLFRERVIKPV